MGPFTHGTIRKVHNEPYLEQPRFKIGSTKESYSFIEILVEYVMLRMLDHESGEIFMNAANMLGKASTADKIIKRYRNGLGGLVLSFDDFVYHIADSYGLQYVDVNKVLEQVVKIVKPAILEAKNEAKKMLSQKEV